MSVPRMPFALCDGACRFVRKLNFQIAHTPLFCVVVWSQYCSVTHSTHYICGCVRQTADATQNASTVLRGAA